MIFYIVFLVSHYSNNLSLFFDIPAMFLSSLFNYQETNSSYMMFMAYDNIRLFSNALLVLPFNILGIPLAKDSILALSNSFSLSYLLMHFFALIINYLVARRTKRYDIAVIAFAFYVICSLPNIVWVVREVHFAVLLYFPLLSYFLSHTKLSKIDLIPIFLLLVYLFESFEITTVFGLLLFFFMHKYSKKETEKNMWYKVLIGFFSLFAAIYIPAKIVYFMSHKDLVFTEGFGLQEWINGSLFALSNMFSSNLIIFVFALVAVLITIFYKKEYSWKSLLFAAPFFALMGYILYLKTGFYPSVHNEMHNYSLVFWFIYPVILTILLLDYYNVEIKKYFITNLLILACIFGSINLMWQIHSNIEFGKYTQTLKDVMNTSENSLVRIPKALFEEKRYMGAGSVCFSTTPASVIISDNKKKDKIIIPSENHSDYSQYCFEGNNFTHYDVQNNILKFQTAPLKPQTKYWDLSTIVEEFKHTGRTIN